MGSSRDAAFLIADTPRGSPPPLLLACQAPNTQHRLGPLDSRISITQAHNANTSFSPQSHFCDIFALSYLAALLSPTVFPAFNVHQPAISPAHPCFSPIHLQSKLLYTTLKCVSAIVTTGCHTSQMDVRAPLLAPLTTLFHSEGSGKTCQ